jgi:hypothetical protein
MLRKVYESSKPIRRRLQRYQRATTTLLQRALQLPDRQRRHRRGDRTVDHPQLVSSDRRRLRLLGHRRISQQCETDSRFSDAAHVGKLAEHGLP